MTELDPKKSSKVYLVLFGLMALVIMASVVLVKMSQDTRRGAYFATATMNVLPTEKTVSVGNEVVATVGVTLPNNVYMDAADVTVKYDSCMLFLTEDRVALNEDYFSAVSNVQIPEPSIDDCSGSVTFIVGSDKEELKTGYIKLADLNFKAEKIGTAKVDILKDQSILSGPNPACPDEPTANSGPCDVEIDVGSVSGATYTIVTGGVTPTVTQPPQEEVNLSFSMRFRGIDRATEYSTQEKVGVRLVSNDGTFDKVFEALAVRTDQLMDDTIVGQAAKSYVYKVNAALEAPTGLKYKIYLSGPKHLLKKLCFDGQTKRCTTESGSIAVGKNLGGYNFTATPLEPGDLPEQDGKVDMADFAKIKSRFDMTPSSEDVKVADLNYDGVINGADITLFLATLSEKYNDY